MSNSAQDSEHDSIEDDLRAAFAADNQAPQTDEVTDDRPRDEHGRFAPKEAAQPVDNTQSQEQSAPQTPAEEPQAGTILPPHSLKATAKAAFASLPREIQEEFIRVEQAAQEAKAEWAPKGELYNKFEAILAPVADRLTLSGIDRVAYVQALVAADNLLRSDPQRGFQLLAQQYGYQLPNAPAGQYVDQQGQQPQVIDPTVQVLLQKVTQLEQNLQSQETAKEQAQREALEAEIETFRNDPKHLYFDNVRPVMSAMLRSGAAPDLQTAYDMATRADPTIWGLMQEQPKQAQPGKPAGKNVTGSPGQTQPTSGKSDPKSSIEDDIRAAFEEVTGRV